MQNANKNKNWLFFIVLLSCFYYLSFSLHFNLGFIFSLIFTILLTCNPSEIFKSKLECKKKKSIRLTQAWINR